MSTRNKTFFEKYRALAIIGEAYRRFPYDDTTGKPPKSAGKITIGIGHNLTDLGLSDRIIAAIFEEDYLVALSDISTFDWWQGLDEARQLALLDLRFNLGPAKFRRFTTTLGYVERRDWKGATRAFRANKNYFKQVGPRAERIAHALETGELS